MPDYQKGKIYRVWDRSYNQCYIGSTCESLSQRMSCHRSKYKRYLNSGSSERKAVFDLFDEYGVENCIIELLENFPCYSKAELHAREGLQQRENDCINKLIAGRSKKQYYEDHKEETKEYKQQWYIENKEHHANKSRENYEANREAIIEQKKQYYKEHKQEIQQRKQQNITCECGDTIRKVCLPRHLKSVKHQQWLNINPENIV